MESRKKVLMYLQGRDADIENRLWTQQGKQRPEQRERVASTYIHYRVQRR